MEGVSTKNKMEVEPIKSLILKMSIPPLISMCMQYSYNLIDCIFVSCISDKSLSAVSIIFPITTLFLAIAIWIGVGVSVLVAKYLGEKDEEKANTIVANGIIVSFVVSSTVTFITMNIIRGFIMSFTSDTEIINQAMVYMDICVFMAIPCAVHICSELPIV